ncbi:alkyl hydroperoxide reductase subunit F [Marisediminitalea sp.]|uniref:alkyl hydroperoxide reductase subunit F n=1 Tax=Marisediminitalea sp. TaxID=2662268 RepID=UPI000C3DDFC9|nr:alkyl hydroperoxide reductase subunit F [Alteromonadaceae bacterium]MCP4233601.1 alkyl hydroperoxide reductase subunit F [Aestuariibacter sp.]MEC7468364.1 alkyl hydroperoxide reductase subunit F [Pseudomonadota bacterium]HBY39616.1 alkyl hydroperoxide reductase subunit F [Alteromonas sp.]MAX42350.1 alkyl hydroperoxide reductase subunit F [Alteromonadaceae bacterium]|tara:strand:- start:6411 stop:7997 length:1587 start_codon:yes stop_codon:yes gene_type:complete
MLTQDILNALKGYAANMQKTVTFVLQTGEHSKREELKKFLSDVAGISDKIQLEERDTNGVLRSSVSFLLEADGEDTGIRFSGIPGGHEFNSFVLAMLHASGTPLKVDDSVQGIVKGVKEELNFEVFISLSCHNCPDVVQALNQFALLNPNITSEMIDGGLYQSLVSERDIQGVPSVYLNGELFANGKVDASTLIDKLLERDPSLKQANAGQSLPLQDVTVIGGGPAGVSSAIYSARKGLKVTVIADRFGGQVKDTMGIENLISVPKTTGPELVGNLAEHMKDYDITLKEHVRVESIEKGNIKTLTLSSGEQIKTKTIIVATGARWRELGVPGEKENIGNGVAYCPHCDGPFFKGKDVAVIGGGNSGIEAALDLAGIVKSVTVFEFMPTLKADQVLINQAEKRENVTIIKNAATKQIVADNGKVTAIEYQDRATDEVHSLPLAGVFVQIGLVPNSQFMKGVVELTQHGEIVVDNKCKTSEPGIFAAGDVTTVPYKQIVISMGEGAKASLSAFEYLLAHEVEDEAESQAA